MGGSRAGVRHGFCQDAPSGRAAKGERCMSGTAQESSHHHASTPPQKSRDEGIRYAWIHWSVLLGLFGFYLLMFLRYRPYDIDNPWFLSFSYNSYVEHICTDQFMNVRFPEGMDG